MAQFEDSEAELKVTVKAGGVFDSAETYRCAALAAVPLK